MNFEIQIDDGSEILPELVVEENEKTIKLHDWQRRGIEYFFDHDCKVLFESCTGSGKTFFTIEIIKQILKKDSKCYVLIVVPKNIILETGWYKELTDLGIPIQNIGVFYGQVKEYAPITITNMQSLKRIATDIFDCLVLDEVHNYGTTRMLKYVKKNFKYKIGLTATLERTDGKHFQILEAFNFNKFTYTPEEALQDGVLNQFNFINIGIEMDPFAREEYEKLTKQINTIMKAHGGYATLMRGLNPIKFKLLALMNKRKDLVNNYYRKFDVVESICKTHKNEKKIIFAEYNKTSSKMYWYLLETGIRSCVFHSDIPKNIRDDNIIGIKTGKFDTIIATKVLDEGYNLPKLEVGIIAAGNSTSKQTVQRMGRVLRRKENRSILYNLFVKDTIEEQHSIERAATFKHLSMEYKEFEYKLSDDKFVYDAEFEGM